MVFRKTRAHKNLNETSTNMPIQRQNLWWQLIFKLEVSLPLDFGTWFNCTYKVPAEGSRALWLPWGDLKLPLNFICQPSSCATLLLYEKVFYGNQINTSQCNKAFSHPFTTAQPPTSLKIIYYTFLLKDYKTELQDPIFHPFFFTFLTLRHTGVRGIF